MLCTYTMLLHHTMQQILNEKMVLGSSELILQSKLTWCTFYIFHSHAWIHVKNKHCQFYVLLSLEVWTQFRGLASDSNKTRKKLKHCNSEQLEHTAPVTLVSQRVQKSCYMFHEHTTLLGFFQHTVDLGGWPN